MTNGPSKRLLSTEGAAGALLRLSLGTLFMFASVNKFTAEGGAAAVSQGMIDQFGATWLPVFLVAPFAYCLPYVEIVLGLVLILGIFTRETLVLAGLLLIALAFGMILQQDYNTVANNFNYVLMTAAALWLADRDNPYSLDSLLGRA